MNLNQVTVPSKNVEAFIMFYETLGLQLIVKALPHYARFVCPSGDSTFSVHLVDELPKGEGTYVYFECDSLDSTVSDFINIGIQFDSLPEDKSWLWHEARLQDLDGNRIILFYAGTNRINAPWRLSNS